jgi:hypothetical protein
VSKDGSSTIKNIGTKIEIELIDIVEYIKKNNIRKIDLIKINIEGGEYALLNRLIDTNYIKNTENILIQFHNFFPEARNKMLSLHKKSSTTHSPIYQYEFIWELWKLNIN